ICATRPAGYTVAISPSNGNAPGQSHAEATCPAGTVVLGGGAYSSVGDPSVGVNMNTNLPLPSSRSWRVDMNNPVPVIATTDNYPTCATAPRRYVPVFGPNGTAPVGAHQVAGASCPTGTVPAGGGAFGNLGSTALNIASTYPLKHGWRSFLNNGAATPAGI